MACDAEQFTAYPRNLPPQERLRLEMEGGRGFEGEGEGESKHGVACWVGGGTPKIYWCSITPTAARLIIEVSSY